ncbi:MAG: hypothetical protein PHH54_04135 [Candidatus Nanoarchaeia archaeon]|nr:hypothetical protein [Candidatus Nanoarchaeia archaeon]MDD5741149.1 hypothetical protein [Candidatus Nanoarchaeia archaeon]
MGFGTDIKRDAGEMEFYLRTGCVHQKYLNEILGDQSVGVSAFKTMPKELLNLKEADWVREMREFYNENGFYRTEDLNRLLGDPIRGVTISEEGLIESLKRCSEN